MTRTRVPMPLAAPIRAMSTGRCSAVRLAVALSLVCALAGCAPTAATPAATAAAPKPAATTTSPSGTTYVSHSFAVPFSLRIPSWLPSHPGAEQTTFVSWDANDGVRKVRVMAPVSVYRPSATTASALPKDFTKYFLGLRSQGVQFADETTTTIGGHPATLVTATTSKPLDGVFGCPTDHLAAGDCFGFQPELVLRMAVVDVSGRPLIVWLREDADPKPAPDTVKPFAALLSGLVLTGRNK